ncbi:MAG: glycoside hydrolase [Mesorhizobium sp.]|nr:MAG: glycoside hydrolase [Mesorhizobium sp.]
MRRFAAFIMLTLLGACSTVDDLAPSLPSAPTVTVRAPRFDDSDPHKWESGAPWSYAVHGTDVSKYQTSVDWPAARASGISFVFIKATEGGDRFDEYFKNVPKDRSAMPPVLDMEWNPQSPTCKLRPDAATVRSEMSTFLEIVEKHYGKKPIIYTSIDFFDDNGLSAFRGYPYWLRSVAGHPRKRYGSHPFTFWQYTGTGIVPGIPGKADINVFNGTEAAWNKWLRQNTR